MRSRVRDVNAASGVPVCYWTQTANTDDCNDASLALFDTGFFFRKVVLFQCRLFDHRLWRLGRWLTSRRRVPEWLRIGRQDSESTRSAKAPEDTRIIVLRQAGHSMIPGTRTPPSKMEPFFSLHGPLNESLGSCPRPSHLGRIRG